MAISLLQLTTLRHTGVRDLARVRISFEPDLMSHCLPPSALPQVPAGRLRVH